MPNDVRSAIRDICAVPVTDDGIAFNSETIRIETIRDQDEYDSLRARFEATLEGARVPMQIDIGFGNAIEPPPTDEHYPVLLDAPRPRIRVYPREALVAEKLHAMVVLGARNSRHKDFYDLHALVRHFDFDGERLARAVDATFERRGTTITQVTPIALTPRFYSDADRAEEWSGYRNRNTLPGAPPEFEIVGDRLRAFFGEPWAAMARGAEFAGTWSAGGPLAALNEVGGRESCTVGKRAGQCPPLRLTPRRELPVRRFCWISVP